MLLPKYSIGLGDRFAQEGAAQLDAAIMLATKAFMLPPFGTSRIANTRSSGAVPQVLGRRRTTP